MEDHSMKWTDLTELVLHGDIIEWCVSQGLIAKTRKCLRCGSEMTVRKTKEALDGVVWKCTKDQHFTKCSVRKNSWFAKSRMKISTILQFTYLWVYECKSKFIARELGLGKQTVVDWRQICRDVCTEACLGQAEKLGGRGEVVEIGESQFGKERGTRGGKRQGEWVLGAIQRGTHKCLFRVVPRRSKLALLQFIKEDILPETTVVSDCFSSYKCLNDPGFQQLSDSRKVTFQDLDTSDCTSEVVGSWAGIKRSVGSCKKFVTFFGPDLFEYIWRKQHEGETDLFLCFLNTAAKIYDPHE